MATNRKHADGTDLEHFLPVVESLPTQTQRPPHRHVCIRRLRSGDDLMPRNARQRTHGFALPLPALKPPIYEGGAREHAAVHLAGVPPHVRGQGPRRQTGAAQAHLCRPDESNRGPRPLANHSYDLCCHPACPWPCWAALVSAEGAGRACSLRPPFLAGGPSLMQLSLPLTWCVSDGPDVLSSDRISAGAHCGFPGPLSDRSARASCASPLSGVAYSCRPACIHARSLRTAQRISKHPLATGLPLPSSIAHLLADQNTVKFMHGNRRGQSSAGCLPMLHVLPSLLTTV